MPAGYVVMHMREDREVLAMTFERLQLLGHFIIGAGLGGEEGFRQQRADCPRK